MASPQSFELLRQGSALLAQGDFEAALQKFDAATQADATDPEAPFFQGVALSRLGRYDEALTQLQKASALGNPHPDQGFETGWALVGLKKWDEAMASLEAYEKAHPGRGQTQEFLGRAYLGAGQLDKAEAAFNEALRRDPKLKGTVSFYQALVAQQRGNVTASRRSLQTLLQEAPNSPLSTLLRDRLRQAIPPQRASSQKPLQFSLSIGGGYNDNALFLGDGIPLPSGSDRQSSAFARATFNGDYTWRFKNGDSATAGYGFAGNFYKQLPHVNDADHLFHVDYRHRTGGKMTAALRVSDAFTQIDGKRYRNQIAVRPSLTFQESDRASTEVAYSYATSNYYFASTKPQNRDGHSHEVSITQSLAPRAARWQTQFGAFHLWNEAKGSDFDYNSTGVFASISHPLPGKFNGELTYSHSWDRYKNDNSQSTPAFSRKRRDDVDTIVLRMTRPLKRRENYGLDFYAEYAYRRDDSNITFYKYNQHVAGAGLIFTF